MNRVLDLQALSRTEATVSGELAGSTSSYIGCDCSTASYVLCKDATETVVAV